MKCRKVTHRYHSLRHVRSVENPSLPGPLSFSSQNYGGLHSLLRPGEGPATKERSKNPCFGCVKPCKENYWEKKLQTQMQFSFIVLLQCFLVSNSITRL